MTLGADRVEGALLAVLWRAAGRLGTDPSVPGTDTGTTDTTFAGAAVLACSGAADGAVAAWCLDTHPAANAAPNATTATVAASRSKGRERHEADEVGAAEASAP